MLRATEGQILDALYESYPGANQRMPGCINRIRRAGNHKLAAARSRHKLTPPALYFLKHISQSRRGPGSMHSAMMHLADRWLGKAEWQRRTAYIPKQESSCRSVYIISVVGSLSLIRRRFLFENFF
jgi:hypothetical protein